MNPFDTNNDRRHAIQSDRPVEPWERPGHFRLDCEPHHGTVLLWMAIPGMIAGGTGVYFLVTVLYAALIHRVTPATVLAEPETAEQALVLLVATVVGMVLGHAAWVLSRRDLAAMKAGLVDPRGQLATVEARRFALVGLVSSGVAAPVYATIVFQVLIRA
jgi:hypothetical protein